jgi:hypothetical protein
MAQAKQHLTNPIERLGGCVLSHRQRRASPLCGLAFRIAHFHNFRQPGDARCDRARARAGFARIFVAP